MLLIQVRDRLKESIVAKMRRVSDEVTAGRASDYADYRRYCGRLQGMKDALDAIDAAFNKLIDEGD